MTGDAVSIDYAFTAPFKRLNLTRWRRRSFKTRNETFRKIRSERPPDTEAILQA